MFDEFDDAIIEYMKRTYNLMVGDRTAEKIMIPIVSAYPQEKEFTNFLLSPYPAWAIGTIQFPGIPGVRFPPVFRYARRDS